MQISEDTRRRVFEAARQLNYHPDATARRMAAGQTNVIGFVLRQSHEQAFADHFMPQVLSGLSQAASAQGFHTLFEPIPPGDNSGTYLRLINERHADGIVLSGPRSDDEDLLKIRAEGAKVVLLGQLPDSDIPFVDVDNVGGACMATQHLIELGHQRIAMITNAPLAYTASTARLAGYRQALTLSGIQSDDRLVRYGNFTPQSGYTAMNDLLAQELRPTAVFVASDTVALGAVQAIRQVGLRVPEDIALVGFDDIPLAEFMDPPLTTIRLPALGLGFGGADLLIRLISGDEVNLTQIILETQLVVRDSSGANLSIRK